MKNKKYINIGIIIILVIALLSALIVIYNSKSYITTPESAPTETKIANVVFESDVDISSTNDAVSLFEQNKQPILAETINFVYNSDSVDQKRMIDSEQKLFQYLQVEYRKWDGDYYWIPSKDTDAKYYVLEIPLVSEENNWIYESEIVFVIKEDCKDPLEEISTNVGTGDRFCSSGFTESKSETHKLRYIVNNNGKVYYAGVY
jgi:hypothetical protein